MKFFVIISLSPESQQKYTFVTFSSQRFKHEVEVSHIDGRQWRSIFFRASYYGQSNIRVDKLASAATTYSFCIKNVAPEPHTFKLEFKAGLEVMYLHNLPDATDGENLERYLKWLDQQTSALSQRAENIEGLRRINYQINGMVGNKMVFMAIIGLAVIGGVNFAFFKILKKTFKDRKLI